MRLTKLALLVAATLSIATPLSALAGDTSSSLRGKVQNSAGKPISNAVVEIIHVPTGKVKTVQSNENGIFQARGLPVGGPYTIKLADGSSYSALSVEDLFLQLSQTASVNLVAESTSQVETIEISGAVMMSGAYKTGTATDFNNDTIATTAAISRDLKSVLQRDPKIMADSTVDGGPVLSIAGSNVRYNSLTVDGVRQNDDFGLNKSGYPTRRSPISLDAIEQISVNVAPFDVTYGNFQGGNINVVTKSGTNEFHGTAFYARADDSMVGDTSKNDTIDIGEFNEDTWGVTLGGPIIQDQLFFFASYEKFSASSPYPFQLGNADGTSSANEIDKVTQADFDRISQIAQQVYDFDVIGFAQSNKEKDQKTLYKLDWYINDDHRAQLTYQKTTGNTVRDFFTNPSLDRAATMSNRYNMAESLEMYSFQLFSYWGDELSTEFKLGSKKVRTRQTPLSNNFAQMEIATSAGGTVYIGPDVFRHANSLDNDLINVKFKADYVLDDHVITAGVEFEELDIDNKFVPWSLGAASYASIDDFENQIVSSFLYSNSYTGVPEDASARFKYNTTTLYLQDEWLVNEDLTLTYGLRYTTYSNDDLPVLNENFVSRHGFVNTTNFDGLDLFEPRVGFNYTLNESTIVRGGFGLFGGGAPNVWLANSYSNDGVRKPFMFFDNTGNAENINGFDGRTIPQHVLDMLAPANSDTNSIDPAFAVPSTWKANLGIEHQTDLPYLGDDWYLTAEVIISRVKDAPVYKELRQEVVDTAPDGRPIYSAIPSFDLMLTNTDKGRGEVYSFSAAKTWELEKGTFALDLGYSYQSIQEVNPGNAFVAFEGYSQPANYSFNEDILYNSEYEIPHRITVNGTWTTEFIDNQTTTVALAFTARSGRHFSYTMRAPGVFGGNGLFWDSYDSQLLYVPTGIDDPRVNYSSAEFAQAFNNFVDQDSCLQGARGGIIGRHECASRWTSRLDLHLNHAIPIGEESSLNIYLNIENLTNLLNSDWGRAEQYPYWYVAPVVQASIGDDGKYLYSGTGSNGEFSLPGKQVSRIPSVWKAQFGVRVIF